MPSEPKSEKMRDASITPVKTKGLSGFVRIPYPMSGQHYAIIPKE